MKKVLCIILAVGLVFLLDGCGKCQTAKPSSAASAVVFSDAVDGTYRITYQWSMLSNDSVGNEWEKTVTCDGQLISSGDTITAANGSCVTIEGVVTEDDKHPDTGSNSVEVLLEDDTHSSVLITVREDHGLYTGNTAEWRLSCHVDRVR